MDDLTENPAAGQEEPSREAVIKAQQAALTAPAVAILLNAYSKNAFARLSNYQANEDEANFESDAETMDSPPVSSIFDNHSNSLPVNKTKLGEQEGETQSRNTRANFRDRRRR